MADTSHDKGNVAAAVIAWWEENRPLGWAEEDHVAQATVNCETDAEQALARLAAQLVRATPPSPSTAPEADPEKDFSDWMEKRGPLGAGAVPERIFFAGHSAGRRSALASRPSEVDDDPPQW